MPKQEIEKLRRLIKEANEAYRQGEALISDKEYDSYIDQLSELTNGDDPLLDKIGFDVAESDERKEDLPIPMYSMNKVKTVEELQKWVELKNLDGETEVIITPKYDGLSLCVNEETKQAWTRGDGIQGQRSDLHFKILIADKKNPKLQGFSFGEVIMKRSVFHKKYSEDFRNSRNMGAGALNTKDPKEILADFDYIRFGLLGQNLEEESKQNQIDLLNKKINDVKLPYKKVTLNEIDDNMLQTLFNQYGSEYEIDGLIIEVNNSQFRKELGREKNGNPVYARAWKGFAAQAKETVIEGVTYQVSKYGLLKPVAHIGPIELDGVTVSNVTLINAKYVNDEKLGPKAKVTVVRSGQVIPKIIEVIETVKPYLPKQCPSCSTKPIWSDSGVELVCPNDACEEKAIQKIIAFFSIIGVENVAEGVLRQFYANGYDTVEKIINMQAEEMFGLEKFAERKAKVIYNAIQTKLENLPLETLQHASSCFEGLGTKKLALLSHFRDEKNKPSLEEVMDIEGFSEKTAQIYIDSYDNFYSFIQDLPITIAEPKKTSSQSLSGFSICFSGLRRADLEEIIIQNGGKVTSGLSKNTTHLVMKQTGTGSAKEKKAEKLETEILTIETFEELLKQAT